MYLHSLYVALWRLNRAECLWSGCLQMGFNFSNVLSSNNFSPLCLLLNKAGSGQECRVLLSISHLSTPCRTRPNIIKEAWKHFKHFPPDLFFFKIAPKYVASKYVEKRVFKLLKVVSGRFFVSRLTCLAPVATRAPVAFLHKQSLGKQSKTKFPVFL